MTNDRAEARGLGGALCTRGWVSSVDVRGDETKHKYNDTLPVSGHEQKYLMTAPSYSFLTVNVWFVDIFTLT